MTKQLILCTVAAATLAAIVSPASATSYSSGRKYLPPAMRTYTPPPPRVDPNAPPKVVVDAYRHDIGIMLQERRR